MAQIAVPRLYQLKESISKWVMLSELAEILNISPTEVWMQYFYLTKTNTYIQIALERNDHAHMFTVEKNGQWIGKEGVFPLGSKQAFDFILEHGYFYVPGGWATIVVKEYQRRKDILERIKVDRKQFYTWWNSITFNAKEFVISEILKPREVEMYKKLFDEATELTLEELITVFHFDIERLYKFFQERVKTW